ncbi:MAG: cold shock domain protein CspD [Gammaproteobacteria bacterium]|nr:cold shock domain protein CspD [Gammaproteobacteria bacterium]|tara:strand:- start:50 stop:271 length:222 start_codon:yes stop_codon:yes gene_type:complete
MQKGKVKWFNNTKGYGFVIYDGDSEDYFVHYSSIVMEGYKSLKAGQQVTFEIEEGEKGKNAVNVKLIEDEKAD